VNAVDKLGNTPLHSVAQGQARGGFDAVSGGGFGFIVISNDSTSQLETHISFNLL